MLVTVPAKFAHRNIPDEALRLIAETAARHQVCLADVLGKSNYKMHSRPRHEAMAAIRAKTKASYPMIGSMFGCAHTTVLYGVRCHVARTVQGQGEAAA